MISNCGVKLGRWSDFADKWSAIFETEIER